MRESEKVLLMVVVGLLVGGCGPEEYNVVIKNVGTRCVDSAHVVYGNFRSIGGVIIPGSQKGHGNPEYPVPVTAIVEWRTEDGVRHRQEVEVKKLLPKRFRGDIVFEIHDDNTVTVRVVPRAKGEY